MKHCKALRALLLALCLCVATALSGAERNYLEYKDVHSVMSKILKQHIEARRISPLILKRSLRVYIDQLDPDRTYFLESEVQPFLSPTEAELAALWEEYLSRDFSVFMRLNTLGQKAIERSRAWRQEFSDDISVYVEESRQEGALRQGLPQDPLEKPAFSSCDTELRQRLRNDFVRFVAAQRFREGDAALVGNEDRVVRLYESRLRAIEREYLFETEHGEPLSAVEREHLFVTHILKALAASLDAHTRFFDSGEAYDMRIRLEKGFKGIGVVLQEGIEGVIITRLIEGGPAEKSGLIHPNDRLVEVDGKSIVDESFRAVLDMIRGEEGSVIRLGLKRTVKDGDATLDKLIIVELRRAEVVVSEDRVDVEHYPVDGGGIVGVIKLHAFYEGSNGVSSEADVRQALRNLHREGRLRGLVLDLRQNTGGFLVQAVKVAGLFISNGVVVVSRYSDGFERVFRDIDGYTYYNGPMVVLTSRASASAAEIVAQALQDYGAAIVVGDEQTYGKGSIQHQTVTDESSTSFFKVTVGRFYTVSGRSTQIRGVQADVVVPSPFYRERIGERFLEYALSNNSIESSFVDDLDDVDYSARYWYRKFYLPTLQKRSFRWHNMLPSLKASSEKRLQNNVAYQQFLKRTGDAYQESLLTINEDLDEKEAEDFQLEEGVNIVKDMILMRDTARDSSATLLLRGGANSSHQTK